MKRKEPTPSCNCCTSEKNDCLEISLLTAIQLDNAKLVQDLLKQDVNPNSEIQGEPPLFHSLTASLPVTQVLLSDHRTDPNIKSSTMRTPILSEAIQRERFDIAYLLGQHSRINVNIVDDNLNKTPLDLITTAKYKSADALVLRELVALLKLKNALPASAFWRGTSLDFKLASLIQRGSKKAIIDCINQGAIPRAVIDEESNSTILHEAAANASLEIMDLLVAAEKNTLTPNINCLNSLSQTPLDIAYAHKRFDIAELLQKNEGVSLKKSTSNTSSPFSNPAYVSSSFSKALFEAVAANNTDQAIHSLAHNGNPNKLFWLKNYSHLGPISSTAAAILVGNRTLLQRILKQPTTDPNLGSDAKQITPLHIAVDTGRLDMVHDLLHDPRIKPYLKNNEKQTALDLSLLPERNQSPWIEITQLFEQKGIKQEVASQMPTMQPKIYEAIRTDLNPKSSAYEILGITPHATQEEIKKAYQQMALLWHPDKHENKELAAQVFQLIKQNYDKIKIKKKSV